MAGWGAGNPLGGTAGFAAEAVDGVAGGVWGAQLAAAVNSRTQGESRHQASIGA